ncbi:MAG TPA: HD-GYP domain-containing protein [Pantanalinema sp.]
MRAIDIDKAQPGMVLAKSIYAADGRPLLREGTALTERYLTALKSMKFGFVYVVDPRAPEARPRDTISDELRQEAIGVIRDTFGVLEGNGASKIGVQLNAVAQVSRQIVEAILASRDVSIQMADLKSHDSYTFAHCVNVCVLGTILGQRIGLDESRLRDLALGLILHDIGKIGIPREILEKPGKLTEPEFDQMKEHCRIGFDTMRGLASLSAQAKIVALQHHEKFDGTGYPKGLQGDDIHINAQIGAITDVFDALTSDRVYRKRFMPHEAIEYLMAAAGTQFSLDLVTTFVANVAPYPPGTLLKLSTGETAIVIDVDMGLASRPIVKIVQDTKGQPLEFARIFDLKRDRTVMIAKVLTDA